MIDRKTWKEFWDVGLLWWINSMLHMFGWAIIFDYDDKGELIDAFPARVKFRGFDENTNSEGYQKVTTYLQQEAEQLLKETKE